MTEKIKTAETALKYATQLFIENKYAEAIHELTTLLNNTNSHISTNQRNRAHQLRAHSHRKVKNYTNALCDFNAITKPYKPFNPFDYYYDRGVCFFNLAQDQNPLYQVDMYKAALSDFTNAKRIQPNQLSAMHGRTHTYLALKQYSNALTEILDIYYLLEFYRNSPNYHLHSFQGRHPERKVREGFNKWINDDAILLSLEHITQEDLKTFKKEALYTALLLIKSNDKKLAVLKDAIDPETSLGKRFWKQEGLMPCSVNKGTLKNICDEILHLEPSWQKPETRHSSYQLRLYSSPTIHWNNTNTYTPPEHLINNEKDEAVNALYPL